MAWRMGEWQEAAELQPPLPDAGDSAPFHQAICSSLKVCSRSTFMTTMDIMRC